MAVTTGVIADDFTGATDIASFMAQQGWRVALLPGMPDTAQCWNEEVDAIVISLKSRSLPAEPGRHPIPVLCPLAETKCRCPPDLF